MLGRTDGENSELTYLKVISNVSGYTYVGGLVGFTEGDRNNIVENDVYIGHIVANAEVAGTNYIGGVIGLTKVSTLDDIYAAGVVASPNGFSVGGISGAVSNSSTDNTTSEMTINGGDNVGGVYGTFSNSQATGAAFTDLGSVAVLYSGNIGGLIGQITNATLENSFSMGSVTSDRYPSGAVGLASYEVLIRNVYSASVLTKVSSKGQKYGLVRGIYANNTNLVVENSYWDTERTGTTVSSQDLGEGKSTAELQCPTAPGDVSCDPTIFADWDATVWDFGTSTDYPVLR